MNALGHVTTVNAVNPAGLPTSVTDPNGIVTLMTYDSLGRVSTVSVQGPAPAVTSFGYDVNGLLTSLTSPDGVVLTNSYDAAHRLTRIQDSLGNSKVFTLDGLGNHVQTQVQTGSAQVLMSSRAVFDSLGRLLRSIGAANQTTSHEYDNNSNLKKITDPRLAVTQSAFDALNRVVQSTDAVNGVTNLTYDPLDRLTSVRDARNLTTAYTVNGFGFVTRVSSPDSGVANFTHDLSGNILSRNDGRGVVANLAYDAGGRLVSVSYPAFPAETVTYAYDSTAGGNRGIGRLTSLADQSGSTSWTYDAFGRVTAETRLIGGRSYGTSYAYDAGGNLMAMTYPSGRMVSYGRGAGAQVTSVVTQATAAAILNVTTLVMN